VYVAHPFDDASPQVSCLGFRVQKYVPHLGHSFLTKPASWKKGRSYSSAGNFFKPGRSDNYEMRRFKRLTSHIHLNHFAIIGLLFPIAAHGLGYVAVNETIKHEQDNGDRYVGCQKIND